MIRNRVLLQMWGPVVSNAGEGREPAEVWSRRHGAQGGVHPSVAAKGRGAWDFVGWCR